MARGRLPAACRTPVTTGERIVCFPTWKRSDTTILRLQHKTHPSLFSKRGLPNFRVLVLFLAVHPTKYNTKISGSTNYIFIFS
jgi:hypothetical protein